jgi:DNA-directed RNA polymerase specialized sigma24 family protein
MGRYLNPCDQGQRLRDLLEIVPLEPQNVNPRAKRRVRKLPPVEVERLVMRYRAGATMGELAADFGIHRETVGLHLKRQQVEARLRPLTPEQTQEAALLYARGLSSAKVGEQLGCSADAVRHALAKAGVAIRPRRGWPKN